MMIETRI